MRFAFIRMIYLNCISVSDINFLDSRFKKIEKNS